MSEKNWNNKNINKNKGEMFNILVKYIFKSE